MVATSFVYQIVGELRSIAHGLANYIIKQHKTAGKKSKKDDKKKEETTKVGFFPINYPGITRLYGQQTYNNIFRIFTQKIELK